MMAWLLGAKKVVGPATGTPAGFAGMAALGSSYTATTVAAVRNGGGADGAAMPAEDHQQQQQQHEQFVPNDDVGDGQGNAPTAAGANNGPMHPDPASTRSRHGDDDNGINPLDDGYGGGGDPNNDDAAAAGAGVADGAIMVAAAASRWFDEDTFNAQKERAMTTERSGIQAVYSELYDALQVLAEAMHADMEERQQRQLHDYQAKVNEIRECCQRSERLEEMLGHIFQSVNMVYNAVWTGNAAT